MTSPLVDLGRRFTVDWLCSADPTVLPSIMHPDYTVHIGDIDLVGLAEYGPATLGQLEQFPGLGLTIHDVITDGEHLCLHFTEHGASVRHALRAAAWRGVALFDWDGARLTRNWTQEDYVSRREQLSAGQVATIPAPTAAPWTTAAAPGSEELVERATEWLRVPDLTRVCVDDGSATELALTVESVEILRIFSAGRKVCFAATWTGSSRQVESSPIELGVTGLLEFDDQDVVQGAVVTDRSGLARR